MAIDLGVPIVSMNNLVLDVSEQYGKNPDYDHPFYKQVHEMVQENDSESIIKERIPLKLLRLTPAA